MASPFTICLHQNDHCPVVSIYDIMLMSPGGISLNLVPIHLIGDNYWRGPPGRLIFDDPAVSV